MADARERAVVARLAELRDELAELTAALVRVPSVTGEEGAVAQTVAGWMEDNGLRPEVKHVSEQVRGRVASFADERDLDRRPNVFGWLRGRAPGGAPPVVLNGHLDVVPPGDPARWSRDPFGGERADGMVWGRGAADMKGPIAAALIALRTLRDCGVELAFDVQMQCVIAEESSSIGTVSALDSEPRPAAAIVLEPSRNVVAPAGGGSLQFTVETRGTAAHAAVPWTGRSALDGLVAAYDALRAFARERNARAAHPLFDGLPEAVPFGVGTFHAGEWRAMLPEDGMLSGRIGLLPGERIEDLRAELLAAVAIAASVDPRLEGCAPVVSWPNEGFPAWETAREAPVVRALEDACEAVAGERRVGAVTFGADAGHFAAAGIPVALFGPGNIEHAHMADERVAEAELVEAAQVLAVALMRLDAAAAGEAAP
ncbi:M20 family metallopeptidase [Conexibacter arvalis]|uniref:Acetylornithine deacetylase n=1 Tax=Conexibacter arvalis TaxID=912552 RepID=A0A840IDS4_9ACTN|nr:M20/M25/M40 family metallo-hydrolase [Conexibacter arvalis]MBB4662100.1 acetylornithine deacetylase [Conexibacter arvalis]